MIEASRYVSEFRGGEGAVRDIVEQVLRARGDWALEQLRTLAPELRTGWVPGRD